MRGKRHTAGFAANQPWVVNRTVRLFDLIFLLNKIWLMFLSYLCKSKKSQRG